MSWDREHLEMLCKYLWLGMAMHLWISFYRHLLLDSQRGKTKERLRDCSLGAWLRCKLPQDQKISPFDLQFHWKGRVGANWEPLRKWRGPALYQELVKEIHQSQETARQPRQQRGWEKVRLAERLMGGERRVGPNTKEMFSASASCKTQQLPFSSSVFSAS